MLKKGKRRKRRRQTSHLKIVLCTSQLRKLKSMTSITMKLMIY